MSVTNETAGWLDANTRYMSAAVRWVRGLLRERAKVIAPATQEGTPAPEATLWRTLRRQRKVAKQPLALADSGLIALDSGDVSSSAAAEMNEIAAAMTPPPALQAIASSLGLSEFERNVLLLCVAMELDTSVASLCARAQGDGSRPFPTFALAFTLFGDGAWDGLSPERPLRYWRLIEINVSSAMPLIGSPLRADERIVNLLKGVSYVDDRLAPLLTALPNPGEVPASQRACAEDIVRQLIAVAASDAPLIQLLGIDGPSKQIVASLVSRAFGLVAQRLDWRLLPTSAAELESFVRLWQRESRLLPLALYLETDGSESAATSQVDILLSRLNRGIVFVATRHLRASSSPTPLSADIDKPTHAEQRACWNAALGELAGDSPAAMAGQFNLNADTIRELVRRATAEPDGDAATLHERLWDSAVSLTRPHLDMLAHRVVPRARWEDIVLPNLETRLLRQIADQVASRMTVYGDWGFAERMSRGLGISVLFAGPTGTGKTMAAEVLANYLRLDLFRIDLSAIMSKYIGETEANLRRLFDAAEDGGAILFFDEADALFGKRTEVKDSHDRYANIEINYLLQRMESYGGLAILATNMKSALDQAFMRRLRFVVDFPFPGIAERKAMWRKAFPPKTPVEGIDAERLARLNLAGGHISVIALNAAFDAARAGTPVTMPIVLNAARIEFRKLGRPINETDFLWTQSTGAVA